MVWLAILLQAAAAGDRLPSFTATERCEDASAAGEVVVCGRTRSPYRLPERTERPSAPESVYSGGGTGMAALTSPARCGLFAGERQCGKREKAEYGYGRGRDPLTVLTRLAGKVADPDGE